MTNSEASSELLGKAREAFPWFDSSRLSYFVEAVQEIAYRASRIEAASRPTKLPDLDREHLLAKAILGFIAQQIQGDSHPADAEGKLDPAGRGG